MTWVLPSGWVSWIRLAASNLAPMPPTGPMVPSGLTEPVITRSGLMGTLLISAISEAASSMPAEGPSMTPVALTLNS